MHQFFPKDNTPIRPLEFILHLTVTFVAKNVGDGWLVKCAGKKGANAK